MGAYDAIIIGTGQSGPSLARRLVAAGQKVAVIERKFFGGTCVNTRMHADQDARRECLRSFMMGVSIDSIANEGAAAAIERSSDPA